MKYIVLLIIVGMIGGCFDVKSDEEDDCPPPPMESCVRGDAYMRCGDGVMNKTNDGRRGQAYYAAAHAEYEKCNK